MLTPAVIPNLHRIRVQPAPGGWEYQETGADGGLKRVRWQAATIELECHIQLDILGPNSPGFERVIPIEAERLHKRLVQYEEEALLLANGPSFNNWQEGCIRYADGAFPGLLPQIATPGSGGTVRVYGKHEDPIKPLCSMLAYMIRYKDACPDTILCNPNDLLRMVDEQRKLPWYMPAGLWHGGYSLHTWHWQFTAYDLGFRHWSLHRAPDTVTLKPVPFLPEGTYLALTSEWPTWMGSPRFPTPFTLAVMIDYEGHSRVVPWQGGRVIQAGITELFICHLPAMQGWLRRAI